MILSLRGGYDGFAFVASKKSESWSACGLRLEMLVEQAVAGSTRLPCSSEVNTQCILTWREIEMILVCSARSNEMRPYLKPFTWTTWPTANAEPF